MRGRPAAGEAGKRVSKKSAEADRKRAEREGQLERASALYRERRAGLLRELAGKCRKDFEAVAKEPLSFVKKPGETLLFVLSGARMLRRYSNTRIVSHHGQSEPAMRVGAVSPWYNPHGDTAEWGADGFYGACYVGSRNGILYITDSRIVYVGRAYDWNSSFDCLVGIGLEEISAFNVQWARSDFTDGESWGRLWVHADGSGTAVGTYGFDAQKLTERTAGFCEIAHALHRGEEDALRDDMAAEANELDTGTTRERLVHPGASVRTGLDCHWVHFGCESGR